MLRPPKETFDHQWYSRTTSARPVDSSPLCSGEHVRHASSSSPGVIQLTNHITSSTTTSSHTRQDENPHKVRCGLRFAQVGPPSQSPRSHSPALPWPVTEAIRSPQQEAVFVRTGRIRPAPMMVNLDRCSATLLPLVGRFSAKNVALEDTVELGLRDPPPLAFRTGLGQHPPKTPETSPCVVTMALKPPCRGTPRHRGCFSIDSPRPGPQVNNKRQTRPPRWRGIRARRLAIANSMNEVALRQIRTVRNHALHIDYQRQRFVQDCLMRHQPPAPSTMFPGSICQERAHLPKHRGHGKRVNPKPSRGRAPAKQPAFLVDRFFFLCPLSGMSIHHHLKMLQRVGARGTHHITEVTCPTFPR